MAGMTSTVRDDEIARFDALAARWWDRHGPMRELHAMNPARIQWVAKRLLLSQNRAASADLAGLSILDIGCGAGIAAEAFARRGAVVTAIDAAPEAIAAARRHAQAAGLEIDYQVAAPEQLPARTFDLVVAYEVVEHTPNAATFCRAMLRVARPGGLVALSTLNRTPASWVMAKLGAEYLLRLLPVGTHEWRAFVTPAELAQGLRAAGVTAIETAGLRRNLDGSWEVGRNLSVNYLISGLAS